MIHSKYELIIRTREHDRATIVTLVASIRAGIKRRGVDDHRVRVRTANDHPFDALFDHECDARVIVTRDHAEILLARVADVAVTVIDRTSREPDDDRTDDWATMFGSVSDALRSIGYITPDRIVSVKSRHEV
jgi:hypothetical protein